MKQHEIPGRVAVVAGNGGLTKIVVTTKTSTAEIYAHGAHVTHFQKNDEQPFLFLSAKSYFAPGKPIRGGVPICYPWFGNRDGEPSHGFARTAEWELVKTSADDISATIHFALPKISDGSNWNPLRTEFVVTVSDKLELELNTTNESCGETIEFEDCLHTYFHVGDIGAVSVSGLEGATYLNFAEGDNGILRPAESFPITFNRETNRTYIDTISTVEIHDKNLRRKICVEKSGSHSTVVWNPWTTQKLPDDFDPAEHQNMVCVESGNVKQNKISLAPKKSSALKVILSSASLK